MNAMPSATQPTFPEIYERELVGPLFRPFADALLDAVALRAGDRVLDVACGTGIVARIAKKHAGGTAAVVGVDISAPMLAVARRIDADIDWREGAAAALPLRAGEQFDVVLCQQGLQFFPDKPAAIREMRRALASGGRLAVSTWRSDDEIPPLRELRRVAERRLGPIVDRRHAFGDPGPIETLVRDAGFWNVKSTVTRLAVRFDDGQILVRLNALALVGMSTLSNDTADDERARIVASIAGDSAEVARSSPGEKALTLAFSTTLVTATG